MHRRIWFLVGAAVAVFALTGSVASGSSGIQAQRAAAFAKELAANRTPQQRMASHTVNFGMEQDAGCFNLANRNCTGAWAAYFGETPVIRGDFINNQNGGYVIDMASGVKATSTYLHINIKSNANWSEEGVGVTHPVTANDYIFTWQSVINPTNAVASRSGWSNFYKAVKNGSKSVTFYWHEPFADFKDLFGYIFPKYAVDSVPWNQMWLDCVCAYDSNGHETNPISDGPYFLDSWTPGQGLTLKANNDWYGTTPTITTINGLIRNPGSPEVDALLSGEVDAIYPGTPTDVGPAMDHAGISHVFRPGFTQEHIDVEFGDAKSAQGGTHTRYGQYLLRRPWFDQALAESLDRQRVANAIYASILGNNAVKPLNNPFYTIGPKATKSIYQYFKPYNYAPQKAINTLKNNGCTGGPNTPDHNNTNVWSCGPADAHINFYTTTSPARCNQSAPMFQQNAIAVGIDLNVQCYNAQPDFFRDLLPTGAFDLAEYAFTGGPDPSGWDGIYQCVDESQNLGGQNYKNYCNSKVDAFMEKGDSELYPPSRTADYENAAKLVSQNVAIIPLYARPALLFYNSNVAGMDLSDNPTAVGPLWNAQDWRWTN